jgi:hypothetical protein
MMEHMGERKPRPRCSFAREFKAEIVELCRRGDRSVGQVATAFDLTETAVHALHVLGTEVRIRTGIDLFGKRCRMALVRCVGVPWNVTVRTHRVWPG